MAKEVAKKGGVSLDPDTFTEGGGLLDNVDVEWKEARFVMWDYNGTRPESVPALRLTLAMDGMDDAEQYYSMGSVEIDEKENKIVSGNVTKSTKLARLLSSIMAAGFPKEKIGDDPSVFEGMKCHMVRAIEPKRAGLERKARKDGRVYEESTLIVDKILSLPWEAEGKEAGADDLTSKAQDAVMACLDGKKAGVSEKDLIKGIFNLLKSDPDRNAILQIVRDKEFLAGGPWEFDAKKGMVKE